MLILEIEKCSQKFWLNDKLKINRKWQCPENDNNKKNFETNLSQTNMKKVLKYFACYKSLLRQFLATHSQIMDRPSIEFGS